MTSPRLLIVTRSLDVGGTERHIALLAPRLLAHGFDTTVLCIGRRGVQGDAVARSGVRIVGPPGGDRLPRRLATALGAARLQAEFIRRPPAIAHFFLPAAYLAGAPAASLLDVPVRIMSRRSQNDYQRRHPLLARAEHALHRRMTAILANSTRVATELVGTEGVEIGRVGLIRNGIDLAAFERPHDRFGSRAALAVPAGALVLAIVANLIPYKGHADLLDALGLVGDRLGPSWRLLVIGRDDGIGASLRQQAQRLGIAGNILWLGERRDVPDLLRTADVGMLVSHEEGFSNAVIEGMAAGLAMIVTDVGGAREAVEDGVSGVVLPPRAVPALAEALATLAGDRTRIRIMGEAARARAVARFGIETCADLYVATYRALLAGGPLPPAVALLRQGVAPAGGAG